jgi:uncharacterized protein YdaT
MAETKKASTTKEVSHSYHVSKRKEDDMWQVKNAGSEKVLKLFKTQKEAIEYAKKLSDNQDGKMVIHKEDGKIRKQNYKK